MRLLDGVARCHAPLADYRDEDADIDQRRVVHASLAAVARDAQLLLVFFLLLSAKDATRSIQISRAAINRKRHAHGRAPLLDHIEVCASLDAKDQPDTSAADHVRGHMRRGKRVLWRILHLRGSGLRGMVRSSSGDTNSALSTS